MSSESSSSSSEASASESSSGSSSESRYGMSGDNLVESGGNPIGSGDSTRSEHSSESSISLGIIRGYNSEDYHREKLDFTRFAVNHIRENRINNTRLVAFREEFSIPPEVKLRIPNMGEQISNPEPRCVAIHPAFLEIRMCLPLQPYVKRFLRKVDIDPTLYEIKHCYKLVGHARDSDGWWYLASWSKLTSHSLIIGLPTSNKEWKKTWFVATTRWGRELTIGGQEQRVRLVFGFPGKLVGKSRKRKMPDKGAVPSKKGKSMAHKRPERTLPKSSLGAKVPQEFVKEISSKRACTTVNTPEEKQDSLLVANVDLSVEEVEEVGNGSK
ncbi:hypothetical protein ACOSP7_002374 [Xanthoceras sorbifolium]